MKVLPVIAGAILAGTFTTASAASSKGEAMTLCKAEIKSSFEDIKRIRTSRFKDRSSGTYITYRVSTEGSDVQKVTCTFRDGVASLTDADGTYIAAKTDTENSDS